MKAPAPFATIKSKEAKKYINQKSTALQGCDYDAIVSGIKQLARYAVVLAEKELNDYWLKQIEAYVKATEKEVRTMERERAIHAFDAVCSDCGSLCACRNCTLRKDFIKELAKE